MKPKNQLRNLSNIRRLSAFALSGVAIVSPASAINVTLNASDGLNLTSFNTALHWDSAAAPSAGNAYSTGPFVLRSPATNGQTHVFDGDSLSIDSGGVLLGKPTGPQTLAFTNGTGLFLNGGGLYVANANSDKHVMTVTGNLTVAASSWVGALGAAGNNATNFETLDLAGTITGSAPLAVAGAFNGGFNTGVVRISGANPGYTGTITVAQPTWIASAANRLLQLNNLNALQNATLNLTTAAANPLTFLATANTGSFKLGGLSGTSSQRLADTATPTNNPVSVDIGGNGSDSTYSGILSGPGALSKSGAGTLTLSNIYGYTGNTTVNGGTLALDYANLADASTLAIASGAKVHLSHGKVDKVTALVLNGVSQPAGVYNSNTPGGYITGTGSIQVYSGPPVAQNAILIASDLVTATVTTSLNGDIGNWSPAGAPAPGADYYTGAFVIRTPGTLVNQDITFAGDSLTLNSGGRFLGKAGSVANNTSVQTVTLNLNLSGGVLDQTSTGGSKGTLRILGSVNVQQPSRVAAFGDGTGQETLEIAAPISGSADLTVAGTSAFGDHRGTVRLSAANPYTGNISVFRPTPVASTIASETNRLLQINHLDALKFASLGLYSTQENPLSFTPASNTNSYNVGNFEGISAQVLADTTGAPVTLSIGANGADAYYDGALSGGGSIIKVGGGTQTFTAVNAYAGNTTVTAGTLVLEQPGLSDTGTVSIVGGASLDLLGGNDIVGGLVLNGVMKGPGIYGAGNSGGLITGDGTLEVVGTPTGSFSTFMDTFPGLSAGDKLPSADPDRDGITNLVEYALSGFDPTLPNSLAGSLSGGTLSFSKRDEAVTNNDISYIIETSINLGNAPGDWTNASPVVNDSTTASYVLPTGLGKVFARLRIVKN